MLEAYRVLVLEVVTSNTAVHIIVNKPKPAATAKTQFVPSWSATYPNTLAENEPIPKTQKNEIPNMIPIRLAGA